MRTLLEECITFEEDVAIVAEGRGKIKKKLFEENLDRESTIICL